jgi:MoxR-like ATPase
MMARRLCMADETAEQYRDKLAQLKRNLAQVIHGKAEPIEILTIALIAGGSVLMEDVPGVGKTTLAKALAKSIDASFNRIQFTPDLLPGDILGSSIYNPVDGTFAFRPGPIFCNVLLADEINRASPRTQSALLQAMQEHHVTVAGQRYDLPRPFHVLATQNPIEQEGTYPLPEAQLDRFLLEIDVPYPDLEAERRMLFSTTGGEEAEPRPVFTPTELMAAQRLVRMIPVGESVAAAILKLVRHARPVPGADDFVSTNIAWGPGPRASQALMLGARARALLDGRLSPSIDDVTALANPMLRHRMAISFTARAEGLTLDGVIDRLTETIQ